MPDAPALSRRRLLQTTAAASLASGLGGVTAPTAQAAVVTTYSSLAPKLPLGSSDAFWHVARRAAHAPTQAMVAQIRAKGVRAWVDAQLAPAGVVDTKCQAMLDTHMPWLKLTTAQLRTATKGDAWKGASLLNRSVLLRHIFSERVLYESVVEAMSDQVYVAGDSKAADWVLDWDRTVIRKHALGKFSSLLKAAVTHPALLIYIDNDANSKDKPNENLGRELLELHTVGVGNYTEADVLASARLLTGHGFDWSTSAYRYRPEQHHVGPLKIMGFSTANAAASGGPAVLASYASYLAHHPKTAQRIATRLAVRFVSDTPSAALVNELAKIYLANDTAIAPVVRAIFNHAEFRASVGQKWRRPQEWAAAMVRAGRPVWKPTGTQNTPWELLGYHGWLVEGYQHGPGRWPAVNGYPDSNAYWMSTHAMLSAWNHAEVIADRWDPELVLNDWKTALGIKVGANVWTVASSMTSKLTGYVWRKEDLTVIASLLSTSGKSVPAASYTLTSGNVAWEFTEPIRMVFASPYFLMR